VFNDLSKIFDTGIHTHSGKSLHDIVTFLSRDKSAKICIRTLSAKINVQDRE
jgi:hypothetical protein